MKKVYFSELHFFTQDNRCFVFDVNGLNFYELEGDIYWELNDLYEKKQYENPFECNLPYANELIKSKILKSYKSKKSDYVEKKMIIDDSVKLDISNLVLQVSNDCNLNCKYCYGSGGTYNRERELMTFEIAKKAIDYFMKNKGIRNVLYVTFFGGEPLLNFSLIKEVVNYCSSIEKDNGVVFKYSMTTNGTIFNDEISDFIKKNKISVMLSMDGGKKEQDSYRCYCNGEGSFDVVNGNLHKFKEIQDGHLTARATVCRPNVKFLNIKKDLLDLGFTNVIMTLVDIDEESCLSINSAQEVLNEYKKLADSFVNEIKSNQTPKDLLFMAILKKIYYKIQTLKSCSAGQHGFAVASNGEIYPCHRFMGMKDFVMGTVESGMDTRVLKKYKHANVMEKSECKKCWARYLCGGACMNTCVTRGGGIMDVPEKLCEIYKGLYEIILTIYYHLKTWDDDYFRKAIGHIEEKTTTL